MSTVLVVDDEYLIVEILMYALQDAGYQVETANNGVNALEVLNKTRVELLITDYMMPAMNGKELAAALREDPQFKTLPIILMTGAQGHLARENPELFDKVLDKPIDIDVVIAVARQLMPAPGG